MCACYFYYLYTCKIIIMNNHVHYVKTLAFDLTEKKDFKGRHVHAHVHVHVHAHVYGTFWHVWLFNYCALKLPFDVVFAHI